MKKKVGSVAQANIAFTTCDQEMELNVDFRSETLCNNRRNMSPKSC